MEPRKRKRTKFKARPKYPVRINGITLRVSRQVVLTVVSTAHVSEAREGG